MYQLQVRVLAAPTIVSGFYAMNDRENSILLADLTHSFLVVGTTTRVLTGVLIVVPKKKNMLPERMREKADPPHPGGYGGFCHCFFPENST